MGRRAQLSERLLALVREALLVHADETPQRVLDEGKTRRAYVWTFRTEELIAYVHSPSRSGTTPEEVLGGTQGYLVVDGYTGYNRVTLPQGRVRVGCWLSRTGGMDRARVGQADRPAEFVREPLFEFAALTRLGAAKRIAAPVYRASADEGLRRRAGGGLR